MKEKTLKTKEQILAKEVGVIYTGGNPITPYIYKAMDTHAEQVAEKRLNDLKEFVRNHKCDNVYRTAFIQLIELFTTKKEEDADK